jgi:Ca2+-binding EF-hand superfamily protein
MRPLSLSLLFAIAIAACVHEARGGDQAKPFDAKAAFAETDKNGDGEIDLEEFHVRVVEVFYNADTNKDGVLTIDEYGRLPFSGEFKEADTSADGRLTLHEFVAIRYRQFVEADTNHDGALTIDEVVAAYAGGKKP